MDDVDADDGQGQVKAEAICSGNMASHAVMKLMMDTMRRCRLRLLLVCAALHQRDLVVRAPSSTMQAVALGTCG